MPGDELPDSGFLVVGDVERPAALFAMVVVLVLAIAWLVVTSDAFSLPAGLVNGK